MGMAVDLSPITDLLKSEVYQLGQALGVQASYKLLQVMVSGGMPGVMKPKLVPLS